MLLIYTLYCDLHEIEDITSLLPKLINRIAG